jgi:hypothetical protein
LNVKSEWTAQFARGMRGRNGTPVKAGIGRKLGRERKRAMSSISASIGASKEFADAGGRLQSLHSSVALGLRLNRLLAFLDPAIDVVKARLRSI